MNKISYL